MKGRQVTIKLEGKNKTLKGVTKSGNRFRADLYYKNRKIYINTFDTKIDAAIAYDDFILDNGIDKETNFKKSIR